MKDKFNAGFAFKGQFVLLEESEERGKRISLLISDVCSGLEERLFRQLCAELEEEGGLCLGRRE